VFVSRLSNKHKSMDMEDSITIDNDELFGYVLELLKEGKEVTIPVKGTSMLPLIREGRDTVALEGVEAATPEGMERRHVKQYDIVLFRMNKKYILHRVLSVGDGVAVIQGDGILKNKEYCPVDHIYGRVKFILRNCDRPVDPGSVKMMRLWRFWMWLKPLRRYILAVYRRLPRRAFRNLTGC